jgi:acid phosphatase family membrane protein YuiD
MPSGHSALVISLTTIIALTQGLESPIFALSFVLAILVIRDAVGLRQYLGEHGKILNMLVKDLDNDKVLEKHYPHLLERIGHTPIQVLAGSALGFAVSIIGYLLFA